MAGIKFERIRSESGFLNPFNNFAEEVQLVAVRKDPLPPEDAPVRADYKPARRASGDAKGRIRLRRGRNR